MHRTFQAAFPWRKQAGIVQRYALLCIIIIIIVVHFEYSLLYIIIIIIICCFTLFFKVYYKTPFLSLWQEYVLRVDPVTNLGLSAESVFSYHLGEITRTKGR